MPAGFDPDDCANPVCGSKMDMFSKAVRASSSAAAASSGGAAAAAAPLACPVDRDELGRSTWDLLHTTAAYYPEAPAPEDVAAAGGLVSGLARLYPCEHCAEDFRATESVGACAARA